MAPASRRELLQALGALIVVASVPAEAACKDGATPGAAGKTLDPTDLDAWIAMSVDGEVTAFLGKGDVGQGIEVAIAQIVAEELDVKVDRVAVILADTALTCDLGGVAGSNGILRGGAALRKAAAEARRILLERAAERLAAPVATLKVQDGIVSSPGKGELSYGQLVNGTFKTRMEWNGQYRNALEITGKAKPKSPDQYTVVGTSPPRRDVAAKVFGTYQYSADVRVPGMLHGRVVRPTVAGARLATVDEASLAGIPNAKVVRKGDFLGVVAEREWDAIQAASTLKVTWEARPAPFFASDSLHDHIRKAPVVKRQVVKNVGSVDDVIAAAAIVVEAEYEWPFQSHAGMGPACAVADVRPDGVTLWNPSQKTHASAEGIAKLLGRPLASVRSIYCQGPGSYGRNDSGDATADAALMSSLCGRPVRVQGMRVDAQGWDPKAPAAVHKARAAVQDGKLVAYDYVSKGFTRQDVSSFESEPYDLLAGLQTGFKSDPAPVFMAPEDGYDAPNLRSAWEVISALLPGPSPLRTSNMRDPLGIQVHFASESFIDECALAAGADPVAFRLAHIADPRHRAAIEAAAELAGWKAGPPGARRSRTATGMVGRGIAYGIRGGTIVATVCEVEVNRESGRVWPRRFWVAHDCGLVVNPGTLKHVIEGNVGFATSRVLFEEVTFDADNVTSLDWSSYRILDIGDAPEAVDIKLINRPEIPPTGAGEAASRPVAPAIANAIFDATGVRLRRAPFTADRMKAAPGAAGRPTCARAARPSTQAPNPKLITPEAKAGMACRPFSSTTRQVVSSRRSIKGMLMNRVKFAAGPLCSAIALIAAAAAHAQTEAVSESPPPKAPAEAPSDIIVTGSRVITNGNASPTPVTVVQMADVLRVQPTTVADALNALPVFSGSRGQFSNPDRGTASQMGGGNATGNYLNLRNMGAVRTLILFDGHRVAPTNVAGLVDVDLIPQQLLQRVDVVTGGASAVYGSDAVTGVVNFVTDRKFNGIKGTGQYGLTQKGDGTSWYGGLAAGTNLGDRGHIEVSYEYRKDDGIGRRSSREFGRRAWSVQGAGTAANPYYLTPDARNTSATFGGLITSGVLAGQTFNQNGVLSPFVHGTASGTAGVEIGGDGYFFDVTLKSPLESHQVFGRFDYELTDNIHAYIEAAGNDKRNSSQNTWVNLNNVTMASQNPFLPAAYRAQLAAANQTTFRFAKQMRDVDRNQTYNDVRQIFFNAGLEGELGHDIKWNLGYVHGNSRLKLTNTNINNGRLAASLDAVTDPASGQIVCNVSLAPATAALYPGCVPLNPFGPTADSQAAVDYFVNSTKYIARTKMDSVTGSITGSPFSTWAGPVNLAISGEWRRIGFNAVSDALPTDLQNCTGLRFNCTTTTTAWVLNVANRSPVSQTVKEGAIEADVPLVQNGWMMESFNLNGALRYTSYDTSGDYVTWKIGVDWHITDGLRVRGTRSRDIRAPTLDDLYSPTTSTVGVFPDLLTGTSPTNVVTVAGGNPDLTAEIGKTWTAGVVYKPNFVSGLSLAIDYFNIEVSDAIIQILASNSTFQRACYASGGSSPYCALQVRPLGFTNTSAANTPSLVRNQQINIAKQTTSGVDFELNYTTRMFARPVSLRWLTTYQPHIKYIQPGVPTLDQAGVAFGTNAVQAAPTWRVSAFLRVSPFDGFNIDVLTRWRSNLSLSADPTHVIASPKVPAASFTNVNLAYKPGGLWGAPEFFVNIVNAFNKKAPPAAFYGGQLNPGLQYGFPLGDDPLGRGFTFGVRFRH